MVLDLAVLSAFNRMLIVTVPMAKWLHRHRQKVLMVFILSSSFFLASVFLPQTFGGQTTLLSVLMMLWAVFSFGFMFSFIRAEKLKARPKGFFRSLKWFLMVFWRVLAALLFVLIAILVAWMTLRLLVILFGLR